jgi:hypothetical protein
VAVLRRRELSQLEMAVVFAVSIVAAVIGTVVALIVLTIIVGLAGGH